MKIAPRIRILFWNTQPLDDAIVAATQERLHAFGIRVANRAKSLLKYRRGSSPPGQPPHVHRDKRGGASPLTNIQAAQPTPLRVVAGPVAAGNIPGSMRTLQEGGVIAKKDGTQIHLEARPFMKPAFDVEAMRLPPLFANSLR